QHDIDALGNVRMPERLIGEPISARHLFGIEADFLTKCTAQSMKRAAFDGVPQVRRIDNKTAVMRAHEALRPYMTGLAIHFDLCNLSHNGFSPERVRDTASGQDVLFTDRFRRWPR